MKYTLRSGGVQFALDYNNYNNKPVRGGEFQLNLGDFEKFSVSVLHEHSFRYKSILNLKQFKVTF